MSRIRLALIALLLLAFGLGQPAHVVQAGAMASMPMVAADEGLGQAVPGDCGGCGDSSKAMAAACSAMCVGPAGILGSSMPAISGGSAIALRPAPEQRLDARAWVPEPYPPRPTVLA